MIAEVTQKLAALAQSRDDAQALAQSAKKQFDQLQTRRVQLHNARSTGSDLAKAAAAVDAAQDLMIARRRVYEEHELLMTRLTAWLDENRNAVLEPVTVDLNGGPTSIPEIRNRIATLAAEYHRIKVANASLDDARAQARQLVERLAARGRPSISTMSGALHIHHWSADEQFGPPSFANITEFAAWLDPEKMLAAIERDLASVPTDARALPLDQRKQRLAEIEARVFDLEIREELLVMGSGDKVTRRHDASPQSILLVKIVPVAAAARAA